MEKLWEEWYVMPERRNGRKSSKRPDFEHPSVPSTLPEGEDDSMESLEQQDQNESVVTNKYWGSSFKILLK